jgi:hypothetical protein
MLDFCKGESYKRVVNLQIKKTFVLVIMNEKIQVSSLSLLGKDKQFLTYNLKP